MPPTLSKSDYKLARTCITKLYYKEHGYPQNTDENEYLDQMERYDVGTPELRGWIDGLVNPGGRLQDMNRLCLDAFMHPGMGGRSSIKVVLDALWKADPMMRDRFVGWMNDASFTVPDDSSPYKALPAVTIDGVELDVSEGTGAMRAYQAMLYGAERHNPEMVTAYRDLLLRYCKLDTLAMVLIWDHWQRVARDPRARPGPLRAAGRADLPYRWRANDGESR